MPQLFYLTLQVTQTWKFIDIKAKLSFFIICHGSGSILFIIAIHLHCLLLGYNPWSKQKKTSAAHSTHNFHNTLMKYDCPSEQNLPQVCCFDINNDKLIRHSCHVNLGESWENSRGTLNTYLLLADRLDADCFFADFSAFGWACGVWVFPDDFCFAWLFDCDDTAGLTSFLAAGFFSTFFLGLLFGPITVSPVNLLSCSWTDISCC